jgi:hypothetical protein
MTRTLWRLDGANQPSDSQFRVVLLRRTMAAFGLALVALTWRLWTPQTVFPQVPFIQAAIIVPAAFQWVGLAAMLAGLFAALAARPTRRMAAIGLLLFAASTLGMAILDQHRLQPWAYQFSLIAVVLALTAPSAAIPLLRLLIVGFYFHSGLTKCDVTFLHALGQQFLAALAGVAGLSVDPWSQQAKMLGAALFPAGEMLVAVGLVFTVTRRAALVGAVVMHLLLLAILGPWGLDHKPGVLVWNAYFIVQDIVLFIPSMRLRALPTVDQATPMERPRAPWALAALVWAAVLLPFLAPTCWFDLWPSWGLYASNAEHTTLFVHRLARDSLPRDLQPFLEGDADPEVPWLAFRIDRWSLDTLAAPLYPQNRFQLGVAEALVTRYQLSHRARVVRFELADRFNGARALDTLSSLPQIVAAGDDYLLNAHPNQSGFRSSDAP